MKTTIQKTTNEAIKHGLLECKTRSFTMCLTAFYNSAGIRCNFNQQNIKFKTIKIKTTKIMDTRTTIINEHENKPSMARYIWRIFQYSAIPLSWGICFASVRTLSNGTEFHVQGFKMTGYVRVEYDEGSDTFTITLTPDDNKENRKIIENVYLDNLISVIDENVEYCENYETRVRQWLKKQAV